MGEGNVFVNGGDENEFATLPLFDHLPRGNLADKKRAIKVDADNFVPFVVRDLDDEYAAVADAGIVVARHALRHGDC